MENLKLKSIKKKTVVSQNSSNFLMVWSRDYHHEIANSFTFFQKPNGGCNGVKTIKKFDFVGESYRVEIYINE